MKTIRTTPGTAALLAISATSLPAARQKLLDWILANEAKRRATTSTAPPRKP